MATFTGRSVKDLTCSRKGRKVLYMPTATDNRLATCRTDHRDAWRVSMRGYGFPCFGGHVRRPTRSSEIVCDPQHGGCGRRWRTSAAYVDITPNYEPPPAPEYVCQDCGRGALPGNNLVEHTHGARINILTNRWVGVYHERSCRS